MSLFSSPMDTSMDPSMNFSMSSDKQQSINDLFISNPTISNFKNIIDDTFVTLKFKSNKEKTKFVLVFFKKFLASSYLFTCITRTVITSSVADNDVLSMAVTDLLKRYTPSCEELTSFLNERLCGCSLKLYMERGMILPDSVLYKITNYIIDTMNSATYVDMYSVVHEYQHMKKVCEEYGYVFSTTVTKPEKKRKVSSIIV